MADEPDKKHIRALDPLPLALALAAIALAGLMLYEYNARFQLPLGPQQPISFSHQIHAGKREVGCLLCHPTALSGEFAGMPPLETCMLCHSHIAITYPEIEKVRRHYFQREPVEWARVATIPDFVYFDHGVHLQRGIDCGRCHGDVRAMDRIVQPQELRMGFCLNCHHQDNATHDCFTCHR